MKQRFWGGFGGLLRSETARKIAGNTGWLMGERLLLLVIGFTVHVWMARYLGPGRFGSLQYAIAFVGLFSTFTYLGLSGLVTRDLVERPEARDEILGTTFVLKIIGAIGAGAVILGLTWFGEMEPSTRSMIVIIAVGLPLEAFTVAGLWFQSRTESRYSVVATSGAAALGAAFKSAAILLRASTVWFAVVLTTQQLIAAVGAVAIYWQQGNDPRAWRVSWRRARKLLSEAWPLMLSSVGAVIYLKIDQVMLGEMSGAVEVGRYAVAARLSELWYFIPAAVGTSVFPTLLQDRQRHAATYGARLQRVYRLLALLGLSLAVAVSLTAGPVVRILYGDAFAESAGILAIHIWAAPAVFMGALLSKWLIAEGFLTFSFTRHLIGAVLNVVLNLALIPSLGGRGAAIATLVAYTAASYLACFTDRRTFSAGVMMTRAFLNPLAFRRSRGRGPR